MQVFLVKKLAEVQAFVNLAPEMLNRAGDDFTKQAPKVAESLKSFGIDLRDLIETEDVQAFNAKEKKTKGKLTSMMELYVGDEWHNPVEVLEWLSFYSGSAAAHSALVCSALDTSESDSQINQLEDRYISLLNYVISALKAVGGSKVTLKN